MQTILPIDNDRPTRALINLENLRHNYNVVLEHLKPKTKIMAIVKANAYGHGILRISQELAKLGADYLGVAFLEEGIFLREHGITTPILVLGAINTTQIPRFIAYDLELTTPSIEKAKRISEVALSMNKKAKIHLKIDTGMERIGVHWYNVEKFFDEIYALPFIDIVGMYSHFAMAENINFTNEQLNRFENAVNILSKKQNAPPLLHLANSAGLVMSPASQLNLVRPGLMLYGYGPSNKEKLKPVMSLVSKVAYFKVVRKGDKISYNHTYEFQEESRVVTIPVGYGDGFNRLLSNNGHVIIRNKEYPIVGNICMDQLMVNLGPKGEAYNGDDVLLFGEHNGKTIPIDTLCQKLNTIPYEITCAINTRVPRIYIG